MRRYALYRVPVLVPFAVDSNWLTVATGVVDCYYNVTDLPPGGTFKFRVACINKAGQGPYSNGSAPVSLDSTGIKMLQSQHGG